ncbi:M20/M25/M40 family metallo-hydrolase [Winogradskyella sp. DF17]|uniref:M20/M25/M40 family metallo-hydrolase n=1 Tax=Winogradskyella pelagia TaxID=2819984 RepID=A0ABS3T3H7_9FLAO|nr:M20/M25/M40 family metallo-hydrolase [Winogradskyella sp. DF17]MBO3117302.1 M20/M25/M40 family metallo-hydrolase [Winogradskyella sp. DF17]
MKTLLKLLLICLFVASCSSSKKAPTDSPIQPITAETVKKSIEYLASDDLAGRQTGTEGIEMAAQYIENYFRENNIKPFYETYRDSFNFNSIVGYNIVGLIEGNDPKLKNEYIILGGHYDHIGQGTEVNGDTIANGANDDASGTVAAMELGRYFAQSKSNKRSVLITLYAAEEMGLKGSGHLAERLKSEEIDVYNMINFEMIGVPRAADKSMAYMSGYNRSNFASTLNKYAGEEVIGFFPKAKEFQLFFRSDNYPFYKALNIPAHAISTFDFTNFDFYHHVDDEADKMDYEHMASFINKMVPAFEGMMNASTKEVILTDE